MHLLAGALDAFQMLLLLAVRDTLDVALCICVSSYNLCGMKTPVKLCVSTVH